MPDGDESGLLTREQFREAVGGASEATLGAALTSLKLSPVTLASDRRQKRYRVDWVAVVKKWLADTYGSL